jgi:hypothetical protein
MDEESDGSDITRTLPGDSGNREVVIEPVSLSSGFPHLPQKFDAAAFSAPHLAQSVISPFPHCAQKLFPGGLSVPHFEQRIGLPERAKRRSIYHLTVCEHYWQAVNTRPVGPAGEDYVLCPRSKTWHRSVCWESVPRRNVLPSAKSNTPP